MLEDVAWVPMQGLHASWKFSAHTTVAAFIIQCTPIWQVQMCGCTMHVVTTTSIPYNQIWQRVQSSAQPSTAGGNNCARAEVHRVHAPRDGWQDLTLTLTCSS